MNFGSRHGYENTSKLINFNGGSDDEAWDFGVAYFQTQNSKFEGPRLPPWNIRQCFDVFAADNPKRFQLLGVRLCQAMW